jgi:hypothetical protein
MRHLNDLTPDERSAYRIWQNKLKDRTLSAQQHDDARRAIDELLWAGPNGQILSLKADLAVLADRIARLEFHAGLGDTIIPAADDLPATLNNGDVVKVTTDIAAGTQTTKVVRADCGDGHHLKVDLNQAVDVQEPKKETRGRKAARFSVEKDANRTWQIMDRESEEYTVHGPYKTRREAKEMADTLNNMPSPPPLEGPKVYHNGDGIIRDVETGNQLDPATREAEASVALDKDPDCGTQSLGGQEFDPLADI